MFSEFRCIGLFIRKLFTEFWPYRRCDRNRLLAMVHAPEAGMKYFSRIYVTLTAMFTRFIIFVCVFFVRSIRRLVFFCYIAPKTVTLSMSIEIVLYMSLWLPRQIKTYVLLCARVQLVRNNELQQHKSNWRMDKKISDEWSENARDKKSKIWITFCFCGILSGMHFWTYSVDIYSDQFTHETEAKK